MWMSVMAIFLIYATIFILFEDYDRKLIMPFEEVSDWHLLLFSLVVMAGLGFLLFRYSKRMDDRISREQAEKESRMRRELTQNIAHELKTPVASILGFTETILDNRDITEEVQKSLSAERMPRPNGCLRCCRTSRHSTAWTMRATSSRWNG